MQNAPLLILRVLSITSVQILYMLKINSLMYFDIAVFQSFKVSLLFPHVCQDFALEAIATEK